MEIKLEAKLIRIGNSLGLKIPMGILKAVKKEKGDIVSLKIIVDEKEDN